MEMNINNINNYDNIRERSHSLSNILSRSASLVSRASSRPYYKKMMINNNFSDEEIMKSINRSQLSYSGDGQGRNCVSMATDSVPPQEPQYVLNEALVLNICNVPYVGDDNIINIQLLYGSDQPMEPELWNGNFYHISLHSSLEHLPSDTSCIKTSLICMARYIKNKKIDITKSNRVKDLQGIGKATWKFISTFHKTGWNSHVANVHNNIFRQKVSFHCTLKTNPVKSGKSKGKNTDKPASVKRLPSSISTKTFKEVNEISKFFRTKILAQANVSQSK